MALWPVRTRRFEDIELVRIDNTLHDVLAKTVRAGDEDHIPEPGLGVEGEDHAARSQVRADHLHNSDRESRP
jgi:hypothetical protein